MSLLHPPRDRVATLIVPVLVAAAVVALAGMVLSGTALGQSGTTVEIDRVGPDTVQVDEVVTIEYTVDGSEVTDDDVTIVFEHPRGHEVTVSGQHGTDISQDVDIEPFDLDPGPYDVRVEVDGGPTAEVEDAIEVAPVFDPDDADFGPTESSTDDVVATYDGVAGDFVTVDVSLNDIDETYVVVGGDRSLDGQQSGAPLDILHVDGSATFVVNTRLVGTDRPSEEVYIPVDGSVTSYAHDLGPDAEPSGVFDDLHFENEEYEQVADTLAEYRAATHTGPQARPLQPDSDVSMVIAGGDSVVVTEEGYPDARFPLDRANVALTRPELGNVTTYRLPTGNADERAFELDPGDIEELEPSDIDGLLDEATETETVTREDRLLVEVDVTGMYGALLDSIDGSERIASGEPALVDPAAFGTLLDRPEGITFEMQHLNPDPNTPAKAVALFESQPHEVSVIVDPAFGEQPTETNRFFVLVDTRELDPFDPEPDAGDEYEVRMSYTPPEEERYRFATVDSETLSDPFDPNELAGEAGTYPYLTPDNPVQMRTATFDVEDRFVAYNQTTNDDEPVVPNERDATLTGMTNLAPGDDLPVNIVIDVRDDPTTVEIENVDIDENGTFEVETDLSMLDPGEEVNVEFWAYQERLDERPLVVADEDDVSGSYEITDLTAEAIVTPDETFVELSTAIENIGLISDNQTVELLLDNEIAANETLELDPGESQILHFEDAFDDLGPGEYPLEVRTADDVAGTMLVVEEAEGVFEVVDIDAESTVDDGVPGIDFGATVRNTGPVNETATVELLRDGEVVAEQTADLLAGQDVTYTFEDELADLDPGNYTLTVQTPDDEATVDVTVEEPEAELAIDEFDVASSVEQGERISPTVVVNNTGTIPGDGAVTMRFDGELIDESTVDLALGENTTLSLAEMDIDEAPGTYTLLVETPDDEATVELIVEELSDSEPGEGSDADGSGDGNEGGAEPGGFLGLGVGRGAVLGGTAIVAGIHVLGYWL